MAQYGYLKDVCQQDAIMIVPANMVTRFIEEVKNCDYGLKHYEDRGGMYGHTSSRIHKERTEYKIGFGIRFKSISKHFIISTIYEYTGLRRVEDFDLIPNISPSMYNMKKHNIYIYKPAEENGVYELYNGTVVTFIDGVPYNEDGSVNIAAKHAKTNINLHGFTIKKQVLK